MFVTYQTNIFLIRRFIKQNRGLVASVISSVRLETAELFIMATFEILIVNTFHAV